MAKTYSWSGLTGYQYLYCRGGTELDPMTFEDIWQYFQDNPIAADFDVPQRLGSSPFELCENNASEWSGVNGIDTPTDDAVDYTKNSYSIKAEVLNVPTADTSATKLLLDGQYTQIYMPSTAGYIY